MYISLLKVCNQLPLQLQIFIFLKHVFRKREQIKYMSGLSSHLLIFLNRIIQGHLPQFNEIFEGYALIFKGHAYIVVIGNFDPRAIGFSIDISDAGLRNVFISKVIDKQS